MQRSNGICAQYSHFEVAHHWPFGVSVSICGWSRWSDDAGNETAHLHVVEIDDDGRIVYEGRFDEDDFEGAYRELERRYYAGEGAAFARRPGTAGEAAWIAWNRDDFDRSSASSLPPEIESRIVQRSSFPDRSAAEIRAGFEELHTHGRLERIWNSALCGNPQLERDPLRAGGSRTGRRKIRMDMVLACRGPRRATRARYASFEPG